MGWGASLFLSSASRLNLECIFGDLIKISYFVMLQSRIRGQGQSRNNKRSKSLIKVMFASMEFSIVQEFMLC